MGAIFLSAFSDIGLVLWAEAGVTLRIITETHAACDHPRLISVPETDYLKFFLLQIFLPVKFKHTIDE